MLRTKGTCKWQNLPASRPPDGPARSPLYDDTHPAVIGAVHAQVVNEQGTAGVCALPGTWELYYSDMLMADKGNQLDQEVDRLG
jgi:hypothetical protein